MELARIRVKGTNLYIGKYNSTYGLTDDDEYENRASGRNAGYPGRPISREEALSLDAHWFTDIGHAKVWNGPKYVRQFARLYRSDKDPKACKFSHYEVVVMGDEGTRVVPLDTYLGY